MNEKKKPIKALSIRTLNMSMIVLSCVLYILLIAATVHCSVKYNAMLTATDSYIECQEYAAMVQEASDYLTEQVRFYVVTAEPEYADNYFEEVNTTKRREKALECLPKEKVSEKTRNFLQTALNESNELMEKEIYAMKLTALAKGADLESLPQEVQKAEISEKDRDLDSEEMMEYARNLVLDFSYQEEKKEIKDNIDYFLGEVVDATQTDQQESVSHLTRTMTEQKIFISILFISNIATFILIIHLIVKPLQIYVKCIREDKRMEITGAYEFQYLALTYNDIYEINAVNEAMLRHSAEHDALTGLMNREGFEKMRQHLKVTAKPLALLLVDVDKFKSINDGYGHEVGDRVLKKIADLLAENFRATDYPARIGGDEFAVIMTDAGPEREVRPIIEKKIQSMNQILTDPTDGLPKVSLSVGVAFSKNGFTDNLYALTDSVLYEVKEHGRCGCRFYEESE